MPVNVPKIKHLAYADDIVIFCSGSSKSIKLVMNVIDKYERSSGQIVNRDKSYFLTTPNTIPTIIKRIRKCSGFMDNNFPFTYLGCHVYVGRKNIVFFDNMIRKIVKRLNDWQEKMLSHGGKVTLIKSVFQFILVYTLSSMTPPKGVLRSHLSSKKIAPGNSHAHVLKMRDIAENHIVQQVNYGSSNFWCDNWSLNGPLANLLPDNPTNSKLLIRAFISNGQWNTNKLKELLPDQLVQQIQIIPIGNQNKDDQNFWAFSDNGKFTNNSAWKLRVKLLVTFGISLEMPLAYITTLTLLDILLTNGGYQRAPMMSTDITWSIEVAGNKAYPNSGLKLPRNSFCDTLKRRRPGYKSFMVRWLNPDRGWVKLNTDGSFLQREVKAGVGGVVRDEYGDIIMEFSTPAATQNHNVAEAQAALCGLNWCKQNGFS
ncbi:uncharacterized protein [Nicotiana sylvestris]|uniref:uncharacterized protein n=1 Tax=Nicotiana sylvestris TaxID=4096 RepID=UPI00388CB070